MKIDVSIGEIADKYTILIIKSLTIENQKKRKNVEKELCYIESVFEDHPAYNDILVERLMKINKKLWDIEDDLRDLERVKDFGPKFIRLARSVYVNNDKRANIKKQINIKYKSEFVEEKSYKRY